MTDIESGRAGDSIRPHVVRQHLSHWTLRPVDRNAVPISVAEAGIIAATVPGTVHTDLLAAGHIEDPFADDNESLQRWIGHTDWEYRCEFDAETLADHARLDFGGIDTVSTITLNGMLLGETRNMHRRHRFDVRGILRATGNELIVTIRSAVRAADAASLDLGARPHANHHPYNAIRKMAAGFGWDWGIDTSTAGLWKPVLLETWSGVLLDEVAVSADVDALGPIARVTITTTGPTSPRLRAHVTVAGSQELVSVDGTPATVVVRAPEAALWWPTGYGDPTRHELTVTLFDGEQIVDKRRMLVGFRHAEVATPADRDGAGFEIRINGRLVLVRGANWIPDDVFPHRVTADRYWDRLDQVEFARVNLLRVWGGGIYESEVFYEECSRRGILVWQDFLLACAAYAEEEPLWSEFDAEAREAIPWMASHAALVVLNGGNENVWGRQEWGWEGRLDGKTWGREYYYSLFPTLVASLAPHVPYTPGSPFSPDPDARQNDPHSATTHIWDVWNEKDYSHYRDTRPRFVAEFGWQGPPTWSTLTGAISDDPLTPESPGMIVHQKAVKGNDKLTDGLVPHFALPSDMEDWHWAMSLNQAIAVRTGIEWFRSLAPFCTGSIMWQFNDCWPVTSWAAVDGNARPKPLLHALRHANAPRLVTIQRDHGRLAVALVNDTETPWSATVLVERRRYSGELVAHRQVRIVVAPRTAAQTVLASELAESESSADEFVVATVDGLRGLWFFAEYRDSALTRAECEVTAARADDGWEITVLARTLVRDLTLLVDKLDPDARADDALLTLLPGERALLRVTGATDVGAESFLDRRVLRSANDLVATTTGAVEAEHG